MKKERSTVLHHSMEGTGVSAIRNQGVYVSYVQNWYSISLLQNLKEPGKAATRQRVRKKRKVRKIKIYKVMWKKYLPLKRRI